ncbi:MAG: hypothetical protein AB1585_09035 [Thermodesulfobacteriota bacterium]
MTLSIAKDAWVYAVISHPGENEKLTGFHDQKGTTFIPILKTKNEGEGFLGYMPREPGIRYEVQAIIFEDVVKYAGENGCMVYLVNEKGEILEEGSPEAVQ